jgi:hypothetical protein
MNHIGQSLAAFATAIDSTHEELVACEDILDAAQHWAEGALPLHEFATIGVGDSCRGRMRFRAWMSAEPKDPRKEYLWNAIQALITESGVVSTRQGSFDPKEETR